MSWKCHETEQLQKSHTLEVYKNGFAIQVLPMFCGFFFKSPSLFYFLFFFSMIHSVLAHYFCLTHLDCIGRDALLSHLSIDEQTKAQEILSHQPNWTTALTWIRISKWKYLLPDQEFKPHIKTAFDSLSSTWSVDGERLRQENG